MKRHRLFQGLMAIHRNAYFVIISPNFDEVLRIPEDKIDDPQMIIELKDRGFFNVKKAVKDNDPEVSLATLIVTDGCNLRCRYCFANSGESKKMRVMSDELAFATIDRGASNAVGKKLSVAFFGGEPTLATSLVKRVVTYARKKAERDDILGVEFGITTNGMCSDGFLQYLLDNNFRITLSTDGPPQIQNYQRPLKEGGPSSAIVERTVRYLANKGADFKIRTTVTEYSVNDMVATIEWLHSLGGEKIQFEPISIAGRALMQNGGDGMNRPETTDFVENLKNAIMKGAELEMGVVSSSYMNLAEPPRKFCDGNIKNRFAVSYLGDMTTCVEVQDKCHPAASQFIVGYFDQQKKDFVITGNRGDGTCTAAKSGIVSMHCKDCFAKNICGGGCPVRNFHTTGEIGVIDPYRCQIIREILPFVIGLFDEAAYG